MLSYTRRLKLLLTRRQGSCLQGLAALDPALQDLCSRRHEPFTSAYSKDGGSARRVLNILSSYTRSLPGGGKPPALWPPPPVAGAC